MERIKVEKWMEDNLDWLDYCQGYAEPGYELRDKKDLIYFADWNQVDDEMMSHIEEHFMIEWSDEWACCDDCGKAVRTQPDGWGWQPYYHIFDCEIYCFDCIDNNNDLQLSLIDELIIKGNEVDIDKDKVNFHLLQMEHFDLKDHGFQLLNENQFENGFHPHQTDDPVKILKGLDPQFLKSNHFIFRQSSSSQFSIGFDLHYRNKEQNV